MQFRKWIQILSLLQLYNVGGSDCIDGIRKVSKVITRAKNSTAFRMIGSQKCPVYLKLSYLCKNPERFLKKIFEEVYQIFVLFFDEQIFTVTDL